MWTLRPPVSACAALARTNASPRSSFPVKFWRSTSLRRGLLAANPMILSRATLATRARALFDPEFHRNHEFRDIRVVGLDDEGPVGLPGRQLRRIDRAEDLPAVGEHGGLLWPHDEEGNVGRDLDLK